MPEYNPRRAAETVVERPEEPVEKREQRYLEKARALGPQPWAVAQDHLSLPGIEAGDRYGTELGQKLHDQVSPETRQAVAAFAHRVASTMSGEGRNNPRLKIVQDYGDLLDNETPQDRELKRVKQQVEEARQRLAPKDLGDVDAVRQPVQMQREFSDTASRDAYIERIRQAQKNAAK